MLKIGKVYKYKNNYYIYVADKSKYRGRNTYKVHRVLANGTLGKEKKIFYRRGDYKLEKNVEIDITILLPKKTRDDIHFLDLVQRSKQMLVELAAVKGKNQDLKKHISRNALASCAFYNSEKGNYNTLRDFARAIGLKSPAKLYNWMALYLSSIYTEKRYKSEIPNASDATIMSSVTNYSKRWKSYHGISKKLDPIFERDMQAYLKEFKDRGMALL